MSVIAGNILITAAYAFITVPHEIINGGVTSFSLVLQKIMGIDIGILTNIITVLLLVICYVGLGKEFFYKSILSSACYMGFFHVFHAMEFAVPLSVFWCVPIASILVGSGYYLCIRANASTVGFDVLALVLHAKREEYSIAKTMRLINIAVILLGLCSYGWTAIVMGIIFTIIQTKILDSLLERSS